jgi:HD-like signal output (HDOD) protein/CheY-like chemotaxis protein
MAPKPQIVFVDDDTNILNGMRRSLRGMNQEWEMTFFPAAKDALKHLEANPVAVVVSDMRMPEMDGAQFLSEVKRLWPQTVRFILSGYSSEESVLRTIGPSHQYLAKPCNSAELIKAIENSLHVRKLLGADTLVTFARRLDEIPALSEHLMKLINLVNSEDASTREVADLVAEDIALSARMLKLTNSAYFGLPQHITDPRQTVSLLGFETVRAVVLVAIMDTQFHTTGPVEVDIAHINIRSLEISEMARRIAKAEGATQSECDEAACVGAMMHIGSLALVSQFPKDFSHTVNILEKQQIGITEAERIVFGADHAAIGAYVLGLWGFNDNIVDTVYHHHRPSQSVLPHPTLMYAHVAQYLGKRIQAENSEDAQGLLDDVYIESMNIRSKLDGWAALCAPVLKKL